MAAKSQQDKLWEYSGRGATTQRKEDGGSVPARIKRTLQERSPGAIPETGLGS